MLSNFRILSPPSAPHTHGVSTLRDSLFLKDEKTWFPFLDEIRYYTSYVCFYSFSYLMFTVHWAVFVFCFFFLVTCLFMAEQ